MRSVLGFLSLSELFPRPPVPSASRQKFILPWSGSPTESLTASWPSGLSTGSTSLRFLVPSTISPELAPFEVARQLHLGSAPRLSQPLSGFLAGSGFAALFHAATVLGIPPFRVFPSQEIAYPSRGRLTSMQLSTDVLKRAARFLSPPVSPTSTLSRGRLVPHTAMSSLFTRIRALPGHSQIRAAKPSRSASFTCFEAVSLPRVRFNRFGFPRAD